MKNIRIWFIKDQECRFVSHLDLNRCMARAIKKGKIPIWHTKGFNPRPYITFSLPLSLGFSGLNESMGVKLLDENYSYNDIIKNLNSGLPEGIRVFKVTDSVMKAGKIRSADFMIDITCSNNSIDELYKIVHKFFSLDEIIVERKLRSRIIEVNIKNNLNKYEIVNKKEFIRININLPAGNAGNVNPNLIIDGIEKYFNCNLNKNIARVNMYNQEGEPFE